MAVILIDLGPAGAGPWGYIPSFLDANDPRPAAEQFNSRYIGGWHPFKGFAFDPTRLRLKYPGDPPMQRIATMIFRNETLHLFESSWVVILQADGSWQVSRMD